jgi:hypothetical protein
MQKTKTKNANKSIGNSAQAKTNVVDSACWVQVALNSHGFTSRALIMASACMYRASYRVIMRVMVLSNGGSRIAKISTSVA